MKSHNSIFAFAVTAALLAGCGGTTNSGAVPATSQANIATDKLQVAVGTAYNGIDGTKGLNVVATFRQTNGDSAVLVDTPTITGPSGFTVSPGYPGAYGTGNTNIGTASFTGSKQVPLNQTPPDTTLGTFGGVFSYGLAPLNSDTSVDEFYIGYPNSSSSGAGGFTSSSYNTNAVDAAEAYDLGGGTGPAPPAWVPNSVLSNGFLPFWPQPFGETTIAGQGLFIVGPPAVPFFNNGTYPGYFVGYSPGFTFFDNVTPTAGSYTLSVAVTPSNAAAKTFTATGTLATATYLAPPTISGVAENGGGLTGSVAAGSGVTETLVFIEDATAGNYYTVEVKGTGTSTWTLPAMLGPCKGTNCQSGSGAAPSIASTDTYVVTAVSFDYPALEAGPPANTSQTPTITGSNGQADLAIGVPYTSTY